MVRKTHFRLLAGTLIAILSLALSACVDADATQQSFVTPQIRSSRTPKPTSTIRVTPTNTPTSTREGEANIYYQPQWSCATRTPVPTTCSNGSCSAIPAQPTTYYLEDSFPLGAHVQIGPINREELGVWMWMDNVQIYTTDTRSDEWNGPLWIATWDIHVQNTSTVSTEVYEFVPLITAGISKVQLQDGTAFSDFYLPSVMAAQELYDDDDDNEFPYMGVEEDAEDRDARELVLVKPGETKTARMATYIPGPSVLEMIYSYQPAGENSGVATWRVQRNVDDSTCFAQTITEVTPGAGGLSAIQKGAAAQMDLALAYFPVEGGTITRGYGCVAEFTGVRGSGCPSGAPWFHNGIDIGVPAGSTYYNPLGVPAEINYAGIDGDGRDCSSIPGARDPYTGLGLFIEHTGVVGGHVVTVVAGHLSDLDVASNDEVEGGEELGATGSTGCSTGPHLHFTVIVDGMYVDPMELLP